MYVGRLRAAGVPVQHLDLPDHAHGCLSLPTLFRGVPEVYGAACTFVMDPAHA